MSIPTIEFGYPENSKTGKCKVTFSTSKNENKIRFTYKKDAVPKNDADGLYVELDRTKDKNQYQIYTNQLPEEGVYYGRLFAYNDDGMSKSRAFKMVYKKPRYTFTVHFGKIIRMPGYIQELKEAISKDIVYPLSKCFESRFDKETETYLDYVEEQNDFSEQFPDKYKLKVISYKDDFSMKVMIENYFNEHNSNKSNEEKIVWLNDNLRNVLPKCLSGYISDFGMFGNKSPVFTITI